VAPELTDPWMTHDDVIKSSSHSIDLDVQQIFQSFPMKEEQKNQ